MPSSSNREVVRGLWGALYERHDFEEVGSLFAEDGRYQDMPAPDAGAVGPVQVAARLRLGLAPLQQYWHEITEIVAEGDTVVTEHTEHWVFPTGEQVSLPFVSIHRFHQGRIILWRDYWNWDTLMSKVPQWWLDHIAAGYANPDP